MSSVVRSTLRRLRKHALGATLLEYAVIAGLLSLMSIVAIAQTGVTVRYVFCVAASSVNYYAYGEERVCGDDPEVIVDAGGGEEGEVDDFVFDTTGLVFPNVVLEMGTVDRQDILTEFAGVYSTDVEYRVRRIEGSSPLNDPLTHSLKRVNNTVSRIGLAVQTDEWSSWATLSPQSTTHVGLQMTPPSDTLAILEAYYEVMVRPVGRDELAETFSFSVTREGVALVFEPDMEVTDVVFEEGTIGNQEVLFDLKGAFNTDLLFQVRRVSAENLFERTYERFTGVGGFTYFGQKSSGLLINDGYTPGSVIKPAEVTKIGMSISLDNDAFLDAGGSYELLLASARTPEDVRVYPFTVSRIPTVLVFEPELAVRDVQFPSGTVTEQDVLFELTGEMNTDIAVSVRFLEPVSMHYTVNSIFTRPGSGVSNILNFASGPENWSWSADISPDQIETLGVRFNPAGSKFVEASAAYEIRLASVREPTEYKVFTFNVSRPATALIFEPDLLVSDVVLPSGTVEPQDIFFDITGSMNSEILVQTRVAESVTVFNAFDQLYTSGGFVRKGQTVYGYTRAWSSSSKLMPENLTQLGVTFQTPSNEFVEALVRYEIRIASAETPEDWRLYSFTVSRIPTPVVFEPVLAVRDVTVPVGETEAQNALFDLSGAFNTDMFMQTRVLLPENMSTVTTQMFRSGGFVREGRTIYGANAWSGSFKIAKDEVSQLGVEFTPSSNVFLDASATYEIRIASVERPDEWKTFTFVASRPGVPVAFNPNLEVRNVSFPVGTIDAQDVLFDLTGSINTDVFVQSRVFDATNVTTFIKQRHTLDGFVRDGQNINGATWSSSSKLTHAGLSQLGVRFAPSQNTFQEATATYEIRIASVEAPDEWRTFAFTVTRAGAPIVFNPNLATRNVTVAAGTIDRQDLLFDLTGSMNTDIFVQTRISSAVETSTYFKQLHVRNGVLGDGHTVSGQATWSSSFKLSPENLSQLGVQFTPYSNRFLAASAIYDIRIASVERPDTWRTFSFTVSRPAESVVFSPTLAVRTVALPAGSSGTDVMFDLGGSMNTDMLVQTRLVSVSNVSTFLRQRYRSSADNLVRSGENVSGYAWTESDSLRLGQANQLGISFSPTSTTSAASATYEIRVASTERPNAWTVFRFTVTRPAS